MIKAEKGNTVKVHYVGTLDSGTQFDSSRGNVPLEFKIGEGELLKKFEDAVIGLQPGESVNIKIPAAEGYGERRDDLVITVDKDRLSPELNPEIGMKLQSKTSNGNPVILSVIEIQEKAIVVDANHELAGLDLNFSIELLEILK